MSLIHDLRARETMIWVQQLSAKRLRRRCEQMRPRALFSTGNLCVQNTVIRRYSTSILLCFRSLCDGNQKESRPLAWQGALPIRYYPRPIGLPLTQLVVSFPCSGLPPVWALNKPQQNQAHAMSGDSSHGGLAMSSSELRRI